MKRRDLERYLRQHECDVERDTGPHTIWVHVATGRKAAVPRHGEIDTFTMRKICADLGIPRPPGK
jgi:hypothetical protein